MIWRVIWTQEYRANPDFTTYLSKIGIVSGFELWFGIIVACIPTLAPLFRIGRSAKGSTTDASSPFGSAAKQGRIKLHTFQSGRWTGEDRDRKSGSQDPFVLDSRVEHEEHFAAGNKTNVTAECTFDPSAQNRASPMALNAIYVRTNIEV